MFSNGLTLIDPAEIKIWEGNGVDLLDKKPDLEKYQSQIQRNVRRLADRLGADARAMCIVCGVPPIVKRAQDDRYRHKRKRFIRHSRYDYEGGLMSAVAITAGLLRLGYPFSHIYWNHIDKNFPKEDVRRLVEELYSHPYRENPRILLLMQIRKVMEKCAEKYWTFSKAYDSISDEMTESKRHLREAFNRLYPNDYIDCKSLRIRTRYGKLNLTSRVVHPRDGKKQVSVRCTCGKEFWTDLMPLITGRTTACSYQCDVEKNDDYTPIVLEVNSGRRFDSLIKAIKYFGLTEHCAHLRYHYRYQKMLYKFGDYIFCEGVKENNGLPTALMRKRFPEVGLEQGKRIPWDPFVREARIAAEEKFANSREGKRLLLERKRTEKWTETDSPIWTPEQLGDYREFVKTKAEAARLRIISEDPFLQGAAE